MYLYKFINICLNVYRLRGIRCNISIKNIPYIPIHCVQFAKKIISISDIVIAKYLDYPENYFPCEETHHFKTLFTNSIIIFTLLSVHKKKKNF